MMRILLKIALCLLISPLLMSQEKKPKQYIPRTGDIRKIVKIQKKFDVATIEKNLFISNSFNNSNTDKLSIKSDLLIEPNPTTGIINCFFRTNKSTNVKIIFFDILGKSVMEKTIKIKIGLNEFQLNISKFINGCYYLNIFEKTSFNITKLVIKY